MKKIVPFNNVLTFDTDVREITAISLEHDIKKTSESISGVFYITGEYKITEGELKKENFSFELPFDIALGCNYDLDTLIIDIDDFRYELTDSNKMKVNIDLYIDGKEVEETNDLFNEEELRELKSSEEDPDKEGSNKFLAPDKGVSEEPTQIPIKENIDLLDEMFNDNKEDKMEEAKTEINIENQNGNSSDVNIFNGFNEEEKYVTYHVYPFTENDTLEKVMEKYNVTKDDLAKYNKLDNLHAGDKLIIPKSVNDK